MTDALFTVLQKKPRGIKSKLMTDSDDQSLGHLKSPKMPTKLRENAQMGCWSPFIQLALAK